MHAFVDILCVELLSGWVQNVKVRSRHMCEELSSLLLLKFRPVALGGAPHTLWALEPRFTQYKPITKGAANGAESLGTENRREG
ncbi:unnamed protein product [Phytomonas sp. EM1]|nr:unnamed protein product [Phytomonas sp. EM1]|eukprot:CCW65394.1 unnamed protein product [Phytomonas sp. isolate EM1]